jgi:hypothetical protein
LSGRGLYNNPYWLPVANGQRLSVLQITHDMIVIVMRMAITTITVSISMNE